MPSAGCPTCGGVWLGPDATMHIMQGLGDAVEEELSAASLDLGRRSLHPAAPDSGARGCPTCGVVMARVPVGSVTVDSCPAHGTFFDRDEIVSVVSAVHRVRADHEQESMRGRFDPAKRSAAGEMAALVVRLLSDWIDRQRL